MESSRPCQACEQTAEGAARTVSLGRDDEIWGDEGGNLVEPPDESRRLSPLRVMLAVLGLGIPAVALGAALGEAGFKSISIFVTGLVLGSLAALRFSDDLLLERETVRVPLADARLIDSMRRVGALPADEEEVGTVARTLSEVRVSRQPRRP